MEKISVLFRLGIKYLYRYRRRYGFLLAALIFGFAIVTIITSAKDGMYNSVYYSAQSHYAGDIIAMGYDSEGTQTYHMEQNEISAILNAAEISGIDPQLTVLRSLLFENGILHYYGSAVELKYVIGCDWDGEAQLLDRMNFYAPPERPAGNDGIILSLPTAQLLNARMGDSVILEVETRWGQRNTGSFIVRGIVRDASIFGYYKVYISRLSLNRLAAFGDEDCSTIGFFINKPENAERKRVSLQNVLSEKAQTGPLVYNRDVLTHETNKPWSGIKIFLYTMPVYLSEVSYLLDAMNILTYSLYGMMLLIILVSAAVTYRLILHERTREMGIMRAIGFYGADLRFVLWTEIVAVGIISLIAGFILAWFINWLVSLLSFSWFPGFEIFMRNGRLKALYLPETMLVNVASIFILLFAMALFPLFRASKKNLPGLLSGEPL